MKNSIGFKMQFFLENFVYSKTLVVYTKKGRSTQYFTKWLNHQSLSQNIYY